MLFNLPVNTLIDNKSSSVCAQMILNNETVKFQIGSNAETAVISYNPQRYVGDTVLERVISCF